MLDIQQCRCVVRRVGRAEGRHSCSRCRERLAVFGHNGAGKTTLLKCAVGDHDAMTGEVRFRGQPIIPGQVFRNVRRGIGFVPQGHNVFRELSVEQNLSIAGLLHEPRAITEVFDLFPILSERRRQVAGSLSGGQQQMLALGMALMTKPAILLLDEPTTGLAPIIAANVLRGLQTINQSMGTAIVIVEQNVPVTLKAVDRAVILEVRLYRFRWHRRTACSRAGPLGVVHGNQQSGTVPAGWLVQYRAISPGTVIHSFSRFCST